MTPFERLLKKAGEKIQICTKSGSERHMISPKNTTETNTTQWADRNRALLRGGRDIGRLLSTRRGDHYRAPPLHSAKRASHHQRGRKTFGKDAKDLLMGMQGLSSIKRHATMNNSTLFRNMFLTMAKDIRVAIMSIADHMHNMKSLEFLPPDIQKEVAQEALYIYAPVASRLGMFAP
jgi:hypothetical protein